MKKKFQDWLRKQLGCHQCLARKARAEAAARRARGTSANCSVTYIPKQNV